MTGACGIMKLKVVMGLSDTENMLASPVDRYDPHHSFGVHLGADRLDATARHVVGAGAQERKAIVLGGDQRQDAATQAVRARRLPYDRVHFEP